MPLLAVGLSVASRSLGRVQELHDAPLAPLTTFRLGGPATRLVTATTDAEVV
ncbi:UDP-N-acetylenolpyruvoylglucosamine reductase, partial [Streptomyces hyaluromycini]